MNALTHHSPVWRHCRLLDAAEDTQTLTRELAGAVAELNPERLAMTEARA